MEFKFKKTNELKNMRGFTLIEILVALFIFAIISVMSAMGIRRMIATQQHITTITYGISRTEIAMTLIKRDLQSISPHRLQDGPGQVGQLLEYKSNGIRFVTANNVNPDMLADRGILRQVAYKLQGSTLIRVTWPVADPTKSTTSTKTVLLNNVSSLEFNFINSSGQVSNDWPPSNDSENILLHSYPNQYSESIEMQQQQLAPQGIEIEIKTKNFGTIRRLFSIGGQMKAKLDTSGDS